MESISRQATFFREAYRIGAVSLENVVSWSDSVIDRSPTPEYDFIKLSFTANAHPLDALHILESLSGDVPAIDVLPCVIGLAHQKLAEDPSYGRELAKGLYRVYVACDGKVPDELHLIGWFDDAFDLAYQGIYGSIEQIQEELFRFTGRFVGRDNDLFKADACGAAFARL